MSGVFFERAEALGVTSREQPVVAGIPVEHGRAQAVQTPQETYNTPLVINATGAYAALLARLAGVNDLPVRPLRRQLYLTGAFADLPQDTPMVVDLSTGFHLAS